MHRIEQLTHKSSTYERAEKSRRDFVRSGPMLVQMLVDDEEVGLHFQSGFAVHVKLKSG
jgi:hypothetical protein